MKSVLRNFFLASMIVLVGIVLPLSYVLTPHTAQAQTQVGASVNNNPAGQDNIAPEDNGSCSLLSIFSVNCMKYVMAFISYSIMQVFAFILSLAGFLLNYSIEMTILKMKDNIDNLKGINAAWSTIRDLANMGFIFILLYEAILTVIQQSNGAGKTIKNVVIAALFINFSLFITKVAVDASNILTIGVYDSISRSVPGGFNYTAGTPTPGVGLSDAFMKPLGLSSIQKGGAAIDAIARGGFQAILINGVMGSILLLIAAVIFVAMSIMLVIRFIIIVFLLILSPLAFLGNVMPGLKKYASQWTEALIGQALFAPLFMIMIWVTLRILNSTTPSGFDNSATGAKNFATLAEGSNGAIAAIFNYAIVIAFLVGSLIIAKQTAMRGGGVAGQMMGKASSWGAGLGGAAAFGAAGYMGRRTIGSAANAAVNSKWSNKLRTSTALGGAVGWTARRGLKKVDEKVAKNSFDLRNTQIGDTLGTGAGQKGGYVAYKKSKDEEKKEVAGITKKLSTNESVDIGILAYTTRTELEARKKSAEASLATAQAAGTSTTALDTQIKNLTKDISLAEQTENQSRATLQRLSDKEIEALGKKLEDPFIARNLAPQKFTAAMKSDAHDDGRKDKIKEARFKEMNDSIKDLQNLEATITTQLGGIDPSQTALKDRLEQTVRRTTTGLTSQELEHVDMNFNNARQKEIFSSNLSQGTYDNALKADNNALSALEKRELSNARNAQAFKSTEQFDNLSSQITAAAPGPARDALVTQKDAVEKVMKESTLKMSAQDMEYADPAYHTNETFVSNLSKKTYEDITKPEYTGLTGTNKAQITATKIAPILKKVDPVAGYDKAEAFRTIASTDVDTLAKLNPAQLGNRDIVEAYTVKKLGDLAPKLDSAKRIAIKTAIEDAYNTPGRTSKELSNLMKWIDTGPGSRMYT